MRAEKNPASAVRTVEATQAEKNPASAVRAEKAVQAEKIRLTRAGFCGIVVEKVAGTLFFLREKRERAASGRMAAGPARRIARGFAVGSCTRTQLTHIDAYSIYLEVRHAYKDYIIMHRVQAEKL